MTTYEYVPPQNLLNKNQFGPGGAGSFKKTSKKDSSSPFPGITEISGDDLYNMFGMGPDKTFSEFDTAYKKANATYGAFDSSRLDAERDRNVGLFSDASGIADVSETLGALERARGANLTVGQQLASGAANKFRETNRPGGNSEIGANMLRAQALLPFLQADYQGAAEERKYADSKKSEAISSAANVAQTLANLATTYTQSLADFNSNKAARTLDYAGTRTNLGLQASQVGQGNRLDLLKTQLQLAENKRQANMQNQLQQQQLQLQRDQFNQSKKGNSSSSIPEFRGYKGISTNTGFQPSADYQAYLNQYGLRA